MGRAIAACAVALVLLATNAGVEGAKKKKKARVLADAEAEAEVATISPSQLRARVANASLALLTITVDAEYCGDECGKLDKMISRAAAEVRVKDPSIVFCRIVIDVSAGAVPAELASLLGPQPGLPQLIFFKEGEPLAYNAEPGRAATRRADLDDDVDIDSPALAKQSGLPTSARAVAAKVLAEASRPLIQPLKTVKQLERFLHLDAWAATHADAEPTRVVGFFPPSAASAAADGRSGGSSARYALFRSVAAKLQSLLPFGECLDPALQARLLGKPAAGAAVQLVKASRHERKIGFEGPWTARALGRFIASHSGDLVQDVASEEMFQQALGLGLPAFLLLMPDSYEDELGPVMAALKQTAGKHRSRLTFIYGFLDTDPWPMLRRALGLTGAGAPGEETGALLAFVGAGASPAGFDFGAEAWLPPRAAGGDEGGMLGGGFALYDLAAMPKSAGPEALTAELMEGRVQAFLRTAYGGEGWPLDPAKGDAEVGEEEEAAPSVSHADSEAGGGAAGGAQVAAECDAAGRCAPTAAAAAASMPTPAAAATSPRAAAAPQAAAAAAAAEAAVGAGPGSHGAPPSRAERDEVKALLQRKLKGVEAQLAAAREAADACAGRLRALVAAVREEVPGIDLAAIAARALPDVPAAELGL